MCACVLYVCSIWKKIRTPSLVIFLVCTKSRMETKKFHLLSLEIFLILHSQFMNNMTSKFEQNFSLLKWYQSVNIATKIFIVGIKNWSVIKHRQTFTRWGSIANLSHTISHYLTVTLTYTLSHLNPLYRSIKNWLFWHFCLVYQEFQWKIWIFLSSVGRLNWVQSIEIFFSIKSNEMSMLYSLFIFFFLSFHPIDLKNCDQHFILF